MDRRLEVGRVFGVEVAVDWSWVVTFVLAAWTLVRQNRQLLPDLDPVLLAFTGAASATGLFASLGAHELARVHVLQACGIPVKRLTLFVLGGVTTAERSRVSPRTEALSALAAPGTSLLIGIVLGVGVTISSAPFPRGWGDLDRLGAPGIVLLEIALANLVLCAVNLLPAYPLDGGRIFRAAIWKLTDDIDYATRIAAWTGQVIGWTLLLVGVGITLASRGDVGVALGMWTCLVGWFIASAAAQGYERVAALRAT
jgi:Zn-dependent protease